MKDSSTIRSGSVAGPTFLLAEMFTLVFGARTKLTDREPIAILTELFIPVVGHRTRSTDLGGSNGPTGGSTKASTKTTRNTAMELTPGPMVRSTKDTGRRVIATEREPSESSRKSERAFGSATKCCTG